MNLLSCKQMEVVDASRTCTWHQQIYIYIHWMIFLLKSLVNIYSLRMTSDALTKEH